MSGNTPSPAPGKRTSTLPMIVLFLVGSAFAILVCGGGIVAVVLMRNAPTAAPQPVVENPPPKTERTPDVPAPPPPRAKPDHWWDRLPDARLATTVTLLRDELPKDKTLLDDVGAKDEPIRRVKYVAFLKKLPDWIRDPQAKQLRRRLRDFLAECYVFEPTEAHLPILRDWLVKQIPAEAGPFPPGYTVIDLDRALWALDVTRIALANRTLNPKRRDLLGKSLAEALGLAVDSDAADLKAQVERLMVQRCYRTLVPTGATSLDTALTFRETLLHAVPEHLPATFHEKRDVELAASGIASARKLWPRYSALLRECVGSKETSIQLGIVDLYAQLDPALAKEFDTVFAPKWAVAQDAKLNQAAKAKAIRKALGILDPVEQLANLTKEAQRTAPASVSNRRKAMLQETARLAHAATAACALAHKEDGKAKFDELVGTLPPLDQKAPRVAEPDPPKKAEPAAPVVVGQAPPVEIRAAIRGLVRSNLHPFQMKAGRTYAIHMLSFFDNYLFLHSPNGVLLAQDDDSGGGRNALIRFTAPADGVYRIIATSFGGRATGPYTLRIQDLSPMVVKGPAAQPNADPTGPVEQADLDGLKDSNPEADRVKAFAKIITKLPADLAKNDLTVRPAQQIARYLLTIKNNSELDEVVPHVAPLAKSRTVTLALADAVDRDADQNATEAVVGAVLGQPLRFRKDDKWQLTCRKRLLRRALDLNRQADPVSDIADTMRNLYVDQATLLGIDAAKLGEFTRPGQVLEAMVKHLWGQLAREDLAAEDKAFLDQVPLQIAAVRYVAQNDLEHTAMLQRAWIRVLAVHLALKNPERAMDIRKVYRDLADADGQSRSVLEQLRGAEEKNLRLWTLAQAVK